MDESGAKLANTSMPRGADSKTSTILFIVGLSTAVAGAAMMHVTVPEFQKVFAGFGADLPMATQFALNYYYGIWLLPILVIFVRLVWPNVRQRSLVALIVGAGGVVLCSTALVIVLYLPIFKLGQAI